MYSQTDIKQLDECLCCGSERLKLTLDLGNQPLANSYKNTADENQEEYPLAINRCEDCFHIQLTHAVNPDLMFKEYLYVSGTSHTMKEHFKWFANFAVETYKLYNQSRQPFNVLDVGCNDGSQLFEFHKAKVLPYGIDPATNLFPLSTKHAAVWLDYFNLNWVSKTDPGVFDIITAQNVFAHNSNPIEFLQTARNIMTKDTLLFVQTSQADMILNGEFDTIYHEHISFYNINSMNELCKRMNMFLVDVTKCPLHGNSYIFVISMNENFARPANIQNLIDMERKAGLYSDATYEKYRERCEVVPQKVQTATVACGNEGGFYLVGYGAAAKGMTLLNYTKLRPDFIIDDNPLKQGKFTPGGGVPIVSIDKLDEIKGPIVFLPLAWNFFDEIKSRIKLRRDEKHDLFLKYFPKVEIYNNE